jgi:hypothetical protein
MSTILPYLYGFIVGAVLGAVGGAFWGRKHPKLVSIAAAAVDQVKSKI